jgi:UDP-glucose 4-epimerase
MSPYGNTKQIGEEIITDVAKVSHINAILLRYFNPIGAHPSAEIENYLLGTSKLSTLYYADWVWITKRAVYGDDYPTPDGTAVRDYIHVVDLAKAHVIALQRLLHKRMFAKVEHST